MANLIGDDGNNNLVGGSENDSIFGAGGNDTLSGGAGVDTLDGGAGLDDLVSFADATGGVTITLVGTVPPPETIPVVTFQETDAPVLAGFGGAEDATIVADPAGGSNTVARVVKSGTAELWAGTTVGFGGGASIPALPFAPGSTTMTLRVWVPEAGITVRLKVEDAANASRSCEVDAVTTVANGWETLTFDFTNQAAGTAALNLDYTFTKASVFFNFGVTGADGGGGTYYFDDLQFISTPPATGTIANDGFGNSETITGVENVLGSAQGDRITGDEGANALSGAAGNDTLAGGAGDDELDGGIGNDRLDGGTGDDVLTGGAGNDLLNGGAGVDSIEGGDGTDTVSFAGATNGVRVSLQPVDATIRYVTFEETNAPVLLGFGGSEDSSIVADPAGGGGQVAKVVKSDGAELWAGTTVGFGSGASISAIPFEPGNTTLTLRVWVPEAGITVRLKVEDAANSSRSCEVDAVTTVANGWETLTFDFTNHAAGTAALNLDYTFNKASVFFNFGVSGADGGGGTYYFDDLQFPGPVAGTIADDGFGNEELIRGVENVIGSSLADRLTGDDGANNLNGNAGNDVLSGGAGNDTLIGGTGADTLTGGAGNDSLVGGTGNDRYVVNSGNDRISETSTARTEIDTVVSSVSWTLGANLERLTLTGSADANGTGNALANVIVGNSGDNRITGGGGNDSLTGGQGADSFRFASPLNGSTNVDTIRDFNPVADRIELENGIFTQLTTLGTLASTNFRANATGTAVDANDFIVYETDTGKLFYDADGSGAGAAVQIATLTGAPALAANDFFVI